MFWECHVVTSSIDKLLEQPFEQLKLQDFLDENDLIQECLNQNQRLIDYLVDKTIMPQLIEQIINLPKDENFRNANVVSELLSGDFPRIQESLLMKENFDLFYSFLTSSNQPILNPILASYFSRIINMLIIRKTTDIIDYFKERETFKDDFLNNLESTTISEILYHLISDSGEQRSNVIKWFEEINLIDGLVEKLVQTNSISAQNNITNLFNELFRLAFEQQMGLDCDFAGPTLSATIERLLNSRHDSSDGSLFSNIHEDKTSTNAADSTDKQTPLVLVQHILSKGNLEKFFDTIINRPLFVSTGCDFLINIFDLLNRHLPTPICQSLIPKDESTVDNERMEINDEGDALSSTKSSENIQNTLTNISKEPLMKIYLLILEIIPSRLPGLINLLSTNCPPLVPSTNENSQTVKYQFISEPLGSTRLNLIKVFSKIIQTISNDFTGDKIFEIFNTNRLFSILFELFLRHIYNNFLHAQFYSIVRSMLYINSLAVKQPTDIWTRTSISNLHVEPFSNSSPFHYLNRASYKFFQSILNSSDISLFERLIDQYELNVASAKTITTSSSSDDAMSSGLLHTRFTSPNSGHIAQILRCLRDHASIFNNYSTFFKSNDEEQIDDETNVVEIRWQSALDYLNEDEKKWAAMHYTERATNNFRINSSASYLIHATSETSEAANQRRQNFHMRSFADSRTPYVDEDDDDDEIERFDIDDEMMKNEQNTNERKVADMKKISFDPEVPTNFTEQTLWHQQDETTKDNDKLITPPTLPDLFENHRNQQDKLNLSNESNFEQLCSIRANDGSSGLIPFQSSSTLRDEAIGDDAVFWQNHPIYLANSTEKSCIHSMSSSSSSSDDDIDVDDDESKSDVNIPDDEKYFVYSDNETTSNNVQSNNMMDIFRRQSSNPNSENNQLQPILSSTPERDTTNISNSSQGNQSRRTLDFTEQEQQTNGEMNIKIDDDDELTLQDNFSFLIAKGMLKRS